MWVSQPVARPPSLTVAVQFARNEWRVTSGSAMRSALCNTCCGRRAIVLITSSRRWSWGRYGCLKSSPVWSGALGRDCVVRGVSVGACLLGVPRRSGLRRRRGSWVAGLLPSVAGRREATRRRRRSEVADGIDCDSEDSSGGMTILDIEENQVLVDFLSDPSALRWHQCVLFHKGREARASPEP